jgi:formylglycine-generating enzyme required for sulfatase activity
VVGVSWFDAAAYCKWRGGRLPTEAEWEKAARGDEGREPYPWNKGLDGSRANFRDGNDGYDNTLAPVGSYPEGVSFYGAMDLVGNVWEWCADYYHPEAYKVGGTINPRGPEAGVYRVLRGGSWRISADQTPNRLSITYRNWSDPESATDARGFRCVRDSR